MAITERQEERAERECVCVIYERQFLPYLFPSHMHIIQISLQHMNKNIKYPTETKRNDERKITLTN